MTHILNMIVLGIVAGMFSVLWTRIIRSNMIFRKFGKWLTIINNRHMIQHNSDSLIVMFIQCMFCLAPWLCFALDLWYIITYAPHFFPAFIGVLASLGAGNFIAEVIYSLRNGE